MLTPNEQREFDQDFNLFFETLEEVAGVPVALALCERLVGDNPSEPDH